MTLTIQWGKHTSGCPLLFGIGFLSYSLPEKITIILVKLKTNNDFTQKIPNCNKRWKKQTVCHQNTLQTLFSHSKCNSESIQIKITNRIRVLKLVSPKFRKWTKIGSQMYHKLTFQSATLSCHIKKVLSDIVLNPGKWNTRKFLAPLRVKKWFVILTIWHNLNHWQK